MAERRWRGQGLRAAPFGRLSGDVASAPVGRESPVLPQDPRARTLRVRKVNHPSDVGRPYFLKALTPAPVGCPTPSEPGGSCSGVARTRLLACSFAHGPMLLTMHHFTVSLATGTVLESGSDRQFFTIGASRKHRVNTPLRLPHWPGHSEAGSHSAS